MNQTPKTVWNWASHDYDDVQMILRSTILLRGWQSFYQAIGRIGKADARNRFPIARVGTDGSHWCWRNDSGCDWLYGRDLTNKPWEAIMAVRQNL